MKIAIITIDPSENRYGTVGDWIFAENGDLLVTTTRCGNKDTELLVALHELVEAYLCQRDGIDEEIVSAWDIAHPDAEEPAEVEGSPYFNQHACAIEVEKVICKHLGIDWEEHQQRVADIAAVVDKCIATPQQNSPSDSENP
jgi:hypothetical protein